MQAIKALGNSVATSANDPCNCWGMYKFRLMNTCDHKMNTYEILIIRIFFTLSHLISQDLDAQIVPVSQQSPACQTCRS